MPTSINSLSEFIRKILKSDRDCPIAITGGTGEGKSTLQIQLIKAVDKKFIMDNLVYSRKCLKEKIINLNNFSGIGVDEAINILFRREWQVGEQKNMIKILDMCRDKNMLITFTYPNFWSLDSHILNSRIKMWLFIPFRGVAILFKPDKNPFTTDVWHRKENEKLFNKEINSEGDFTEGFKSAVTQSPNFVDWLEFGDLDELTKKEYLEHKLASKMKFQEEKMFNQKEVDILNEKFAIEKSISVLLRLKEKGFLKRGYARELAEIFGMTTTAIYDRTFKLQNKLNKQYLNTKEDFNDIKEETSKTNELIENGKPEIQPNL